MENRRERKDLPGNEVSSERSDELSAHDATEKRPYEMPRLIAFGSVRNLTQQRPPIFDCSGIACNE